MWDDVRRLCNLPSAILKNCWSAICTVGSRAPSSSPGSLLLLFLLNKLWTRPKQERKYHKPNITLPCTYPDIGVLVDVRSKHRPKKPNSRSPWKLLNMAKNELSYVVIPVATVRMSGLTVFLGKEHVWFVSWKIHDIRLTWPGTAWLLQGMNCAVHSLKKSGRVRRCRDFFREWTKQFFPRRSHSAWHGPDFFRECTTQFIPWRIQAVSGRAMNFSGMNHTVLSLKSQAWENIGKNSSHANFTAYRKTSHTLNPPSFISRF